jgi:Tfp pilus assembly protein PilO
MPVKAVIVILVIAFVVGLGIWGYVISKSEG